VSVGLYGPEFFEGRSGPVMASASAVIPLVLRVVQPKSVLDVGCGKGEWVKTFWRYGVEALGIDIASPEEDGFLWYDLTEPLVFDEEFDMVLCLETGEHLPEEAADTLVETCVTNAPKVVFSAAVPGQEGTGHINCQPHEYWHEKFAAFGYEMSDPFRSALQDNPMVSPWYRDNLFLYS
jgi:hypothetical protein